MDVVLPIVSHEPLMVLLKMSAQTCVVAVDVEPDCAKIALPFEGESGSAIVLPEIFNCRIAAPLERPRIPKPPTWRMSLRSEERRVGKEARCRGSAHHIRI